MKKAMIFDLDGTLWDSTQSAPFIWKRVLDKHHLDISITQEKVASLMGKTMEEIGNILFPSINEEKRNQIIDDFSEEEVNYLNEHGTILYEGIEETLEILSKKYDLYIVSNCQKGYVEAFLHTHHLEKYFKDIEMSGRTGKDKGHNILLLMERNHIQEAIYIGDTQGDQEASRFAGIPFIFASYGFGNAWHPDKVIKSFKELTNF